MSTHAFARDWRANSLCRDEDPELFYPLGETAQYAPMIEAAKAVCHQCPVMQVCGQWALEHHEDGIWGGTSEGDRSAERRALARRRPSPPPEPRPIGPCGTEAGAKRHRRAQEPICPGCASAERQANQRRKQGVS